VSDVTLTPTSIAWRERGPGYVWVAVEEVTVPREADTVVGCRTTSLLRAESRRGVSGPEEARSVLSRLMSFCMVSRMACRDVALQALIRLICSEKSARAE
jgi:hypothetical protein